MEGAYINIKLIIGNRESGFLIGCFGFNGPLRQYFSLYRAVFQMREKEERKDRGE